MLAYQKFISEENGSSKYERNYFSK